jgi:glutathione synthase/RimK-type ligase-like ATP-grasp enzyme
MPQTVLILSHEQDEHVHHLLPELERYGTPWVLLDPGAFPSQLGLQAALSTTACQWHIQLGGRSLLSLETIGSVWYRRPTPIRAEESWPELLRRFVEREARAAFWGLLRGLSARWVNHPDAIRAASWKPQQLQLARRLGVPIPRTLITTDPQAFRRFYEACQGQVVYKLLGFPSYEVEGGAVASTYTSLVPASLLTEAWRIRATAHLFQEYLRKRCDVRVIVIGTRCFAVELHPLSEAARQDFRRDYGALRYAVHHLPQWLQQRLLALMRCYHLRYGAFDLLLTEEGSYVFLELNPVGQLGWLEDATGLPLFRTLAAYLSGKPTRVGSLRGGSRG